MSAFYGWGSNRYYSSYPFSLMSSFSTSSSLVMLSPLPSFSYTSFHPSLLPSPSSFLPFLLFFSMSFLFHLSLASHLPLFPLLSLLVLPLPPPPPPIFPPSSFCSSCPAPLYLCLHKSMTEYQIQVIIPALTLTVLVATIDALRHFETG